jgi:hypothetical protein
MRAASLGEPALHPVPDRPPVLRFLALFVALLTLALTLAALSPDRGPVDHAIHDSERGAGTADATTRALSTLP